MKHIDYNILIVDEPGRMNTKLSNVTLHQRLFIKRSPHNVQHTNSKMWQYITKLFEEDSLKTRNNSEVAPKHQHRTREQNITNKCLEWALYEYMTNTSAPLTYNSVLLWAGTCAVGRYHGYNNTANLAVTVRIGSSWWILGTQQGANVMSRASFYRLGVTVEPFMKQRFDFAPRRY